MIQEFFSFCCYFCFVFTVSQTKKSLGQVEKSNGKKLIYIFEKKKEGIKEKEKKRKQEREAKKVSESAEFKRERERVCTFKHVNKVYKTSRR